MSMEQNPIKRGHSKGIWEQFLTQVSELKPSSRLNIEWQIIGRECRDMSNDEYFEKEVDSKCRILNNSGHPSVSAQALVQMLYVWSVFKEYSIKRHIF